MFLLFLPPQGFAFTGRDKPGFRPEFLPLTYLAKILSDIEEQGIVCLFVCVCVYPAFGGLRVNVCVFMCVLGQISIMKEEVCVRFSLRSCISLCFFLSPSSGPFRGAGERGRQVRGGDGSEADTRTAGL